MKSTFGFSIKDIAEIAILCALAIILDRFVRIGIGSSGGSINISMVPLYIIALRHGWFKSFIAGGFVYGLITCLLDGYGIQTYPFEYLLAFGAIAILGIFATTINKLCKIDNKKNVIISYAIMIACIFAAAVIRYFGATIDSMMLWGLNLVEALIYNASYVFISAIAVCVIMCVLLPTIKMLNNTMPSDFIKNK